MTIREPAGTRPAPLPPQLRPPAGVTRAPRLIVLGLRSRDPVGGPPWGIRLAVSRGVIATTVAMELGRIVHGRIGFLGRDGVFRDDDHFHAAGTYTGLAGAFGLMSPVTYSVAGSVRNPRLGTLHRFDLVIPAVASANNGCSTATAEFATCPRADLRTAVAGFVGSGASTVTITGEGIRDTTHLDAADAGFYLFLLDRPWDRKLRFTMTVGCRDGSTSHGLASASSNGPGTPYCPAR